MSWFVLTILSVLIGSIATILQRILLKDNKSNPYMYAIVFHFILGVLVLLYGFIRGVNFAFPTDNILIFLLSSFLWAMCSIFLFKALKFVEASEITIISSFKIIVTILASIIFLKESFSFNNILGTILVLVSTFLVVDFKKKFVFNSGFTFVVLSALFAGLAIVLDSANVQHYDVTAYSMYQNFLSAIIILICAPKSIKNIRAFIDPKLLSKMIFLCVFSASQGILYLMALSYGGNTALVGSIRQSSTIVTVVLAILFLGERDKLAKKVIAAILVTVAVVLLS